MDEKGASAQSDATIVLKNGVGRYMIFDKPFLVYLKKKSDKSPYLAFWITDTEFLVKSKIIMLNMINGNGLKRKLGLFSVTNIVIANMIGTGIFITSGLLLADLNNPMIMILIWIAGGIMAFFGAMCYGELGAAYPQAGGEYNFLSKLFHPMLGFLSGWVSFIVGFSAPIAAASIGFSEYFVRAVPQVLLWGEAIGISDPQIIKKVLSATIIILFTLVHLRGIEFGAIVQNGLTIYKVVLITGILFIGFLFGKGNMENLYHIPEYSFDFGGWKTIGLSFMWITFSYCGWNASTYIGSEIKNPERNIPYSLLIGTGTVIVLYVGLNILFVYAITPEEMKGVISVGGLAVGNLFGKTWGQIFSFLVSLALFSSISAFIILGPRIYFAMAKNGHFFRFASKVHPRSQVPARSIILQSAIAIVLIFSGTFDQILTFMGFTLGIFPILTIIGVFKLRSSGRSKYRMPGYPYIPGIYVLIAVSILILAFFERPVESSVAIGTVILGIPAYFLFLKSNKKPYQF